MIDVMIDFTANDWFNVTGQGWVASINVRDVPGVPNPMRTEADLPVRTGDHVRIGGMEYEVRGVEYARALVSPPFIKPDISVQVRAVGEVYGPPYWTEEHRNKVKAMFDSTDMCRHCCERVPVSEIQAGRHEHPAVMDQ
jgi:hypothetical protein